ncbi:unnamed protein product [Calypogeia fissa]
MSIILSPQRRRGNVFTGTPRRPTEFIGVAGASRLQPGEEEREEDSVSEEERAKISQVRRWFGFVETQEACE